jgi:predicted type IV restriction endonuclease
MPKPTLDKSIKKALSNAKNLVESVLKADGNEAETRRRVERIFASVLEYDVFKHVSREYAVHGVADTEYCDFAVCLEPGKASSPDILVEIKRVGIDLVQKHLKQVASYAINNGCEWVVLTNSREWRLYHISFSQPPETKLIESWDLLKDDLLTLHKKFDIICYKNLKKKGLNKLWQTWHVLNKANLLKILLSEEAIRMCQRGIKKAKGVTVSPEDIVGAFRHLLNESALIEMDKLKISLPAKQQHSRLSKTNKRKASSIEVQVEEILAEKQ